MTISTELQHFVLAFLLALFASGGAPQNLSRRRVALLDRRQGDTTSTSVCVRWSHQAAMVNSTIYIYGGQAKKEKSQTADTWNNNFLALSLNENWDTSSPKLTGFPKPKGPPPVANGYLWRNSNQLFLYGGLFSDNPEVEPTDFQLWQYDISSRKWSTVDMSVSSDSGSQYIQRVAEGAGVSIPGRPLGFYFGGHLDHFTTRGWGEDVTRVYLKSMLEYDMNEKQFNNITMAGLENAEEPGRADGVLVFVPWGPEGILLAIGGSAGTAATPPISTINVYDLSSKKWTKQSTDGPAPQYRFDPCAAVASAPDGSSHNVYFFGGQNLLPPKQLDDMWILTIPAFKWIQVDQRDQPAPGARSGHTCDIVGSQMVVIGGIIDGDHCDSSGIFVFDASKLQWMTDYSAALGGFGSENSGGGQSGSGGHGAYKVPESIISVIGGNGDGGATVTEPFQTADPSGPIATSNPTQYKYTTFLPAPTFPPSADLNGRKVGGIVGGAVGGLALVFFLFALAYWLYRRKVIALRYKNLFSTNFDKQDSVLHRRGFLPSNNGKNPSAVDLNELQGEPSFWGVLLSPRRSLKVVNH